MVTAAGEADVHVTLKSSAAKKLVIDRAILEYIVPSLFFP
jgi:hypothetical protein